MSTRLADYDYQLPPEFIALRPLPRRDESRMMVLRRETEEIEHARVSDLPKFLRRDDLLVLNNSRVLAARHYSDDGKIEFLFLEKLAARRWKGLVKPGRKFRAATSIRGTRAEPGEAFADGTREIVMAEDVDLHHGGLMPLPPYLNRPAEAADADRYQTVFADEEGSLAAPTAGLHFTPELLREIPHTFITLHVGTGTFRPVKTEDIRAHQMHAERYRIPVEAAAAMNRAGRRVAVGTTTARVLESVFRDHGQILSVEGETNIFIYPPFKFQAVGALLTNFHLPRSTLLMLVSAFAGRELILRAYAEAVRERYRFFSYGDCMLIF